jgi:hypothetical protein
MVVAASLELRGGIEEEEDDETAGALTVAALKPLLRSESPT